MPLDPSRVPETSGSDAAPAPRRPWTTPSVAELPPLSQLTLSSIGGTGGTGGSGSGVI